MRMSRKKTYDQTSDSQLLPSTYIFSKLSNLSLTFSLFNRGGMTANYYINLTRNIVATSNF